MQISWHERMNHAIDYIESNLCGKIDLSRAAQICCQSLSGFQRIFSVLTDMPVSEYIRKRRMSLAARELRDGKVKIIDLALKYGYDSPDAFTRAFKEIYGVSPSASKKNAAALKAFPRISFLLTIKGDVKMETVEQKQDIQIANMYALRLPPVRLIGKKYLPADLDENGWLDSKWNDWFQNGWFGILFRSDCLPGFEKTVVFGIHQAEEAAWWIGGLFAQDTPVPDGFSFTDLPEGVIGMSWLKGYKQNKEIFSHNTHALCAKRWIEAGGAVRTDFNGKPCKWSFECYDGARYTVPDNDGKIILDYGIYLVDSDLDEHMFLPAETLSPPESSTTQSFPLSPEVQLTCLAPSITPAETDPFCSALTTMIMRLKNDEDTPSNDRTDAAGDSDGLCGTGLFSLEEERLRLYSFISTVTGVGLMTYDINEAGAYQMKEIRGLILPGLEDRLDFAMKALGFQYVSLDKRQGLNEVFRQIAASVRLNRPVLLKADSRPEWLAVTGVDSKTKALFGLDYPCGHFTQSPADGDARTEDGLCRLAHWFGRMERAVIVTGKAEALPETALFERMCRVLHMENTGLQNSIAELLTSVSPDNAWGIAVYLNGLADYIASGRWCASVCFSSSYLDKGSGGKQKQILDGCSAIFSETYESCHKIKGLLCIGPHTAHEPPNHIGSILQNPSLSRQIKELFDLIWNNDRSAAEQLSYLAGYDSHTG